MKIAPEVLHDELIPFRATRAGTDPDELELLHVFLLVELLR